MNRDRLLADAKARALALAEDYKPPEPPEIVLPGPSGKSRWRWRRKVLPAAVLRRSTT